MSTQNENANASETPIFEPFPVPNTMPSGWDLSEFSADDLPAPAESPDDATDA